MEKALNVVMITAIAVVSAITSLVAPLKVYAGAIATDVYIAAITNTSNNVDMFNVDTSSGDGSHPCEQANVTFALSNAGNSRIHDRAFSIALAAYTAGRKVTIYSYTSNLCSDAAYIKALE